MRSLRETMRETHRAYSQGRATHEELVAAQRAYESERERLRRDAEVAEARAEHDALVARVEERLSRPIPEALPEEPVGLISPESARWAGMAPSVVGGAIFVGIEPPDALRHSGEPALLAVGRWPNGRPIPEHGRDRLEVIVALRAEVRRMAQIGPALEEEVDELLGVVDRLEGARR